MERTALIVKNPEILILFKLQYQFGDKNGKTRKFRKGNEERMHGDR